MTAPRLLDLYCCAGGAAVGYVRAGFRVYGVDLKAQPNYPFPFRQDDALAVMRRLIAGEAIEFAVHPRFVGEAEVEFLTLADFDAIHASPPCHDHSALRYVTGLNGSLNQLPATLSTLTTIKLPWIVENVVGAVMPDPIVLCGSMFGLSVESPVRGRVVLRRHRQFSASFSLTAPNHPTHKRGELTIGVYGNGDGGGRGWKGSFTDRKAVMGIDWMNRNELSQSIPPAYTEHLGRQLRIAL